MNKFSIMISVTFTLLLLLLTIALSGKGKEQDLSEKPTEQELFDKQEKFIYLVTMLANDVLLHEEPKNTPKYASAQKYLKAYENYVSDVRNTLSEDWDVLVPLQKSFVRDSKIYYEIEHGSVSNDDADAVIEAYEIIQLVNQ